MTSTRRYQQVMDEIGRRLRDIRDQQDLTLDDVETRTGGRFTAAAVASWERGDRNVAIPKLAELARFYRIPVNELIPDLDRPPPARLDRPAGDHDRITIELHELRHAHAPGLDVTRRYIDHIRLRRGEDGTRITLRHSDLRALAALLGITVDDCRRLLTPTDHDRPDVIITLDETAASTRTSSNR